MLLLQVLSSTSLTAAIFCDIWFLRIAKKLNKLCWRFLNDIYNVWSKTISLNVQRSLRRFEAFFYLGWHQLDAKRNTYIMYWSSCVVRSDMTKKTKWTTSVFLNGHFLQLFTAFDNSFWLAVGCLRQYQQLKPTKTFSSILFNFSFTIQKCHLKCQTPAATVHFFNT